MWHTYFEIYTYKWHIFVCVAVFAYSVSRLDINLLSVSFFILSDYKLSVVGAKCYYFKIKFGKKNLKRSQRLQSVYIYRQITTRVTLHYQGTFRLNAILKRFIKRKVVFFSFRSARLLPLFQSVDTQYFRIEVIVLGRQWVMEKHSSYMNEIYIQLHGLDFKIFPSIHYLISPTNIGKFIHTGAVIVQY